MGNCWSFQANPKHYLGAVRDAHNFYRAHHGSPPLDLDKKMCREASMQANLCAYYDKVIATSGGAGYSENIYVDEKDIKLHSPFEAVNAWYETMRFHNFQQYNPESKEFCHMIWKSSKKLGVGIARTNKSTKDKKSRRTFVVCQYDPPAVYEKGKEDFKWNVLRPAPINKLEIPAARVVDGPQAAYNPKMDLALNVQGPQQGWGIPADNPASGKWAKYFQQNSWAASNWKSYIDSLAKTKTANIGIGNAAGSGPPNNTSDPGAPPSDSGAGDARRKREEDIEEVEDTVRPAESADANAYQAGLEDQQKTKREEDSEQTEGTVKPVEVTPNIDVYQAILEAGRKIKRRSVSPEVRKTAKRQPQPEFTYQRYFNNE